MKFRYSLEVVCSRRFLARPVNRPKVRLALSWRQPLGGRQRELEGGSSARIIRRPNAPVMGVDRRAADGEPHAAAIWLRREIRLKQPVDL